MKKLRNQNGLTLTEMLCTVIIVLLFSSLVAVGANAAVRSFRISMADSQAQELCSTLTTAISDKLRYCTVETDAVFIQGVGYVKGPAKDIFTVNDSGQVYLGKNKFLGAYAYPEGLKVQDFSVKYDGTKRIFTVAFQIKDRRDTKLAEADFQVKQINQETN
jgi:prepilin-type N-terminal cleavage/methylation domain-containing protein